MKLQFPAPYFGGKSRVAMEVWAALGDVKHYMEPFFGSGAVLLARPNYQPDKHIETVCDKDGFVCNVWRALQFAPDEVARWCDWPVNHADLIARRAALRENERHLLENLVSDDKWFDPVMAGYWIWAASCWIGSGLTLNDKRPHLSNAGRGIQALGKRTVYNSQIIQLSGSGNTIHALRKRACFPLEVRDVREPYNSNIYVWFRRLSERMRYVRVVCGDWTRICGGNWQDFLGIVGIFFDPPYGVSDRDEGLYYHDDKEVSAAVRRWCLERGDKPTYRIVLAGYWEEHQELLEHGWTAKRWKTGGGYGKTARLNKRENQGIKNRMRETLFFSPHCLGLKLF